ncbi:MAG: hypothetical protein AAFR13_07455 [Pseudomonadota bacterium]
MSWGEDNLIPRGKEAWVEWSRMGDEDDTTVKYELLPLSIAMVDDTTVVNYFANIVSEDNEGERETVLLGITETLVREDDEWSYHSSVNFAVSGDD